MWSRPVVLVSVAGAVLLSAGTAGAVAASGAFAGPAPAAVGADAVAPVPLAQPVAAPRAPAPPSVPGVMPGVAASASCTVLTSDPATGVRTLSLTVTYTVTGGAYRLDTADGPLSDGGTWTRSFAVSRTSPGNPVSVPNLLAATAFAPSGSYLGVISGPAGTASC